MRLCSAVATVLAFVGIAYAQSPFVGTWKMNRDKTQFDANSGILKIEADAPKPLPPALVRLEPDGPREVELQSESRPRM